jgi:hypothetical protein
MFSLGQFSHLVGAPPRWVQNAMAVLKLAAVYDEPTAARLALALTLTRSWDIPLNTAYPLARRALHAWPASTTWEQTGSDGCAVLTIDLERFLSDHAVRLSFARLQYAPRARGRPRKHPLRGLSAARAWGVDLSLLRSAGRQTPGDRVRSLDRDIDFLRSVRVVDP